MGPPTTEAERRWSPDPERVENFPFVVDLPYIGRIIGRQGLDIDTHRLVEFSMTSQVERSHAWFDVARVDTAHEEVHLHIFNKTGQKIYREVILPIYDPTDVDRGWEMGETNLIANWDEYLRRWRCGR